MSMVCFTVDTLLAKISDSEITKQVGVHHDNARISYRLNKNTVSSFGEYEQEIGRYYKYHVTACVIQGGVMPLNSAMSQAKLRIERHYQKYGGNVISAFKDARLGTQGGLRQQLDIIAESLKGEAVEDYIRHCFDSVVSPDDWEGRLHVTKEFLRVHGKHISSDVKLEEPERYVHEIEIIIRTYANAIKQASLHFNKI